MKDGQRVKMKETTEDVLITDEAEKHSALQALAGKVKGALLKQKGAGSNPGAQPEAGPKPLLKTGSFAGDMAMKALQDGGRRGRDSFAAANAPVLVRKPSRTDDMAVEDPAALLPLQDDEVEPLEGQGK